MNKLRKKRFSKSTVSVYLLQRLNNLIDQYNFDSNVGWVQVEGLGEVMNRAYGEFITLQDLVDNLDTL